MDGIDISRIITSFLDGLCYPVYICADINAKGDVTILLAAALMIIQQPAAAKLYRKSHA